MSPHVTRVRLISNQGNFPVKN